MRALFKLDVLFALLVVSSLVIFPLRANATIYAPGATLEPDCAPGSPNCGVSVPSSTNIGNTNLTLSGPRTLSLGGNTLTFEGTTGDVVVGDNGNVSVGGNFSTPGSSIFSGNVAMTKGSDYPTTGIQNNVNLGSGVQFRYTGISPAIFTGISGGTDGRIISIINSSNQLLTVTNEDSNSLSANRINSITGANLDVASNGTLTLEYDSGSSRWRVLAIPLPSANLIQGGNAFGATAVLGTTDANPINFITSGATRFSIAPASTTLTGTGATSITTDSSLSLSSSAGSALNITSGTTGNVTLDSGTTGDVNIGTGANAKTVTIGNITGATILNLNSGSGNIALNGDVTISGGHSFTTGTGITIQNSNALDLAANNTVINMSGTGTLGLNTVNNRAIITGSGLLTMGGAVTVTGLATFNDNTVLNGDVTLGNNISDRIVFNGSVPGAHPIVFDGATGDANFLTLAVSDPTAPRVATIPVLTADDTFVFQSQSQTLTNKTLTSPVLDGSLSGTGIDIDATLAANSDTKLASQKAVKAYVDSKAAGIAVRPPVNLIDFIETDPGTNVVGHVSYTMDGVLLTNGMRVIFGNNSVPALYNDKVFLVGGVGVSISLTLQTDGQAGNGNPTAGDSVFVTQGTLNANKTYVWNLTSHHWEESNSLAGALVSTNNLSDVSNTATARTNLGLGTTNSPTFAGLTANGNILQTGASTLTTGTGLLTASGNATVVGLLTGQAGAVIAGSNITLNHDSNFNVELATGSSTGTVLIGGGTSSVAVNSTTWDISTLGAATGLVSLSSATASPLTVDSGTTGALNIGTSTDSKTITVGNTAATTAININSGSGGINFGGNTSISGSNTFTTGTGNTTINSTLVNLDGNSTVVDMTGTGTLGLNTVNNRAITTGSGLFTTGGDFKVLGATSINGNLATPKGTDYSITGTQNDVNFGFGAFFRYTGAGIATFTGIAGGTDGRQIRILNASSFNMILTNQDVASADANRIITSTGGSVIIPPQVATAIQYDINALKWRVVAIPATPATVGGFAFLQNGNGFGTTAILGTTDANPLNLITSGLTRFTILSGGNVGIGNTLPTHTLDVSGTGNFNGALTAATFNGNTITTGSGTLYSTTTGSITSSQLATSLSDETGTGAAVFATSPSFTTPNIGSATGSISGNAGTATALQTPRAINGVNFDGTAPITVTAAAGTLTGTTLAANVVSSSLTGVGALSSGSIVSGFGTIATANSITTSNNISATGTGTITSAGLLTASNGLTLTTGALNLTGTSGALTLSGLSSSSISSTGSQTFTSAVTTGTGASSAFVFNASSLSSGTGLRLTSTSTSGLLLDQNATNTSGTIEKLSYGSATSLTGATTGLNIDLSTNVTETSQSLTGISLALSGDTNMGTHNDAGLTITQGAHTQNTAAATGTVVNADLTMGALTLTSGTALNAHGVRVTTGSVTQTAGALTENGLLVDSTGSTITTGGTINGLKILGPTTVPSVGTYNNLFLGTSTGATANTIDQATIAVGNIASTATNNFSTLHITNGGSGFLDMELIRGFINIRDMNTLADDFTGSSLDVNSKWTSTATGGATTCGILAGGLNGLLRERTGNAANRGCELTTQAITTLTNGYYQAGNNPILESKLKIDVTANARIQVGFTDTRVPVNADNVTTSHHAYIEKRAADTTWQCTTDDGGTTETRTDTGVTIVAGTFYRLRVSVRNGTIPETICTVDDGTTITRTVNTTHLPGTTSPMDAYVRDNQSDAVQKNMDVDYVRAWQDDPPTLTNTLMQPEIKAGDIIVKPSTGELSALLGDVSIPLNDDSGNNNLSTFLSSIKSENAFDPIEIISKKVSDGTQFLTDFVSARVTAIRGYFDEVFAKKVHTDQICVKKSDGNEVCVNGDQLDAILKNTVTTLPAPSVSTPAPTSTPTPHIPDSTPAVSSAPIPTSTTPTDPVTTPAPAPDPTTVPTPAPAVDSANPAPAQQ